MSDITRIPDAAGEPSAYVKALLGLVGDRDPVDVLAETPSRLAELVRDLDDDRLNRPGPDGGWSPAQLMGHLLDVELVVGFRLRQTLTADEARYPGYDQDAFAELPKPGFREVFAAYRALREMNVFLLRSIPAASWTRVGRHEEQGEEPLSVQVRKTAGHDLAHLDQLGRTLDGR
jgi:DinB superfamily